MKNIVGFVTKIFGLEAAEKGFDGIFWFTLKKYFAFCCIIDLMSDFKCDDEIF